MDHQQGNNNEQPQGMGPAGSNPIPYGMGPSGSDTIHYGMGPSGSDTIHYGMGPSGSDPIPYGMPPYQANQMMGPTTPSSVGPIHSPQISGPPSSPGQLTQQQLAYQHIQKQQHQLQQLLQGFWAKQLQDVENATDFKNHSLPLARIKKIMKADEDVRMISAEAPVIFARACEMFILELTLRAWNHTEENKRRTLQKNDISTAITKTDIFDFLVDIIPREDMGENVLATPIPRQPFPLPTPGYPYYYMPQQPPVGLPGMFVGKPMDQGFYAGQQQHACFAHQQIWPQIEQEEEEEDEQQQEQQQPSDES